MNLNRVLVFCEQQSQNAAFCKEGFVFHLSDILVNKNICLWVFLERTSLQIRTMAWKGPQMSKVRASSNEYPHVEKTKCLREQNFKGEANNN